MVFNMQMIKIALKHIRLFKFPVLLFGILAIVCSVVLLLLTYHSCQIKNYASMYLKDSEENRKLVECLSRIQEKAISPGRSISNIETIFNTKIILPKGKRNGATMHDIFRFSPPSTSDHLGGISQIGGEGFFMYAMYSTSGDILY